MRPPATERTLKDYVVTHPLDPEDGAIIAATRAMSSSMKGVSRGIEAREPFDAMKALDALGTFLKEMLLAGAGPHTAR